MKETMDADLSYGELLRLTEGHGTTVVYERVQSLLARLAMAELGDLAARALGMRHLTRAEVAEHDLAVVKADVTRLTNTFMAEIGSIVRSNQVAQAKVNTNSKGKENENTTSNN
jgi:hypothetical protein